MFFNIFTRISIGFVKINVIGMVGLVKENCPQTLEIFSRKQVLLNFKTKFLAKQFRSRKR